MLYFEIATAYIHYRSIPPPFLLVQSFLNPELLNEAEIALPGYDWRATLVWSQGQCSAVTPALACLVPNIFHWSIGFSRHNSILGTASKSLRKTVI